MSRFVVIIISHFGLENRILVLIVPVLGLSLSSLLTFEPRHEKINVLVSDLV